MKKINKKGFTLVELLAVIVLLGIVIASLAMGIVRIQNNAKRNTFVTSFNTIKKQVVSDYMNDDVQYITENENKDAYIDDEGNNVTKLEALYGIKPRNYSLSVVKQGDENSDSFAIVITLKAKGQYNTMSRLQPGTGACKNVNGGYDKCEGREIIATIKPNAQTGPVTN